MISKSKRGLILILSSPSGAGKTTLAKKIQHSDSNFKISVSYTTRTPRPNEIDGVDYNFVDVNKFQELSNQNKFLEKAKVFGNYYGTSKSAIRELLRQGIDVFLDIDWQGARQIKALEPSAKGIFILPPSLEELEQRLNKRGQDSSEVIAKRMAQAHSEMSHADEYEYLIINDNFETALAEFERIVLAQRNSFGSQASKHSTLLKQLLAKTAN